jgi:hypothetical protein
MVFRISPNPTLILIPIPMLMRMTPLRQLSKENLKSRGIFLKFYSPCNIALESQSRNTKEVLFHCAFLSSLIALVFRCGKKFKAQIQTNV